MHHSFPEDYLVESSGRPNDRAYYSIIKTIANLINSVVFQTLFVGEALILRIFNPLCGDYLLFFN